MDIRERDLIELLRAGVSLVPPIIIAVILLGGPTAAWLLYRFVVQPHRMRMLSKDLSAMWVCPACRSVNDLLMPSCYRCDSRPIENELEIIDTRPTGPGVLVPVGPGLDLDRPGVVPRRRTAQPVATAGAASTGDRDGLVDAGKPYPDPVALPDLAAMTEVIDVPGRHRSGRAPQPVPVGPGRPVTPRPVVARPRRAVVAGPAQSPDDQPAA